MLDLIAILTNLYQLNEAKKLSEILNIPLITDDQIKNFKFLLVYQNNHLSLIKTTERINPIFIDFLSGNYAQRKKQINQSSELLRKAIKIKGVLKPFVLDATAGLAQDAFILSELNCRVLMVERSPIIAALIQDALNRYQKSIFPLSPCLSLIQANSITYLSSMKEIPDIIYLDPMFPVSKKSSLAKKEIRILRELVGADLDSNDLLNQALQTARYRVVVKRPAGGTAISSIQPDFSLKSKIQRLDIYLTNSKK